MNEVLKEIIATGSSRTDRDGLVPLHSHIPPEEGRFIEDAIHSLDAEVSVEVGLAYGISALYICQSLQRTPRTCHYVIDPSQNDVNYWRGIGMSNLRRAGYASIVRLIERPSHQAVPQLEMEGVRADFAFIDGLHTFDHTLVDFFLVDRILKCGGIVVLDDVGLPSIRNVCSFILANRAYSLWGEYPPDSRRISWTRKLLNAAFGKIATVRKLGDYFRPLSLDCRLPASRYIAFRKDAEDSRDWRHFVPF